MGGESQLQNVDCHAVCPCTAVLYGVAASAPSKCVEYLPTFQFVASLIVPGFLYVGRCQYAHLHILIKIKLLKNTRITGQRW